ncbi:hypothetical protein KKA14_00750, partial [bacterium]|nr:hypothetical protein [bacterium]
WWLRYKALKIAFGVPGLISDLDKVEMIKISMIIDLAFAFHIRLSDVFTKPGDQRKFDSHRERVLIHYLSTVFPEGSDRRTALFATFIGDVEAVNVFENTLREVFQGCVFRIQKKASQHRVDNKTTKEFELWHHFYMQNFKPKANVIQRTILNHLKIPRGRVQIGFQPKKGWFFKSLQRESLVGRRFEFSIFNLLPEEISLIKDTSFLYGLVYCVINDYYGVFARGTLKETLTAIEYDRKQVNLGSDHDNHLAFVRPDQIERLMQQIIRFNDPLKVGYLDCINKERKIISVMVFLNLLKYGRLSLLYRDNLDVLYVDSYDLPGFPEKANDYLGSYQKMFKAIILHKVLARFFKDKKINPRQTQFYAWVNTNSVETTHATTNEIAKENDLSENFKNIILSVHGKTAA